jgi:hypothetical protein
MKGSVTMVLDKKACYNMCYNMMAGRGTPEEIRTKAGELFELAKTHSSEIASAYNQLASTGTVDELMEEAKQHYDFLHS